MLRSLVVFVVILSVRSCLNSVSGEPPSRVPSVIQLHHLWLGSTIQADIISSALFLDGVRSTPCFVREECTR